jgi:hypothetical protein
MLEIMSHKIYIGSLRNKKIKPAQKERQTPAGFKKFHSYGKDKKTTT